MDGRIIKNRAAMSMKLFSLPLFSHFIRQSYAEDAIGNENKKQSTANEKFND